MSHGVSRLAARLWGAVALAVWAPTSDAQTGFAITHVTVIDGRDSMPRREQTVIIRGNRIRTVGATASVKVSESIRVIDGRGKFLIPGLWDMPVHTTVPGGRDLLGLYIANGVTGVRDVKDDFSLIKRWRTEIAAGEFVGPRLIASGPYIEDGDTPIPHLVARTPAKGRTAVDSLAKLGVDFVKLHAEFTPDTYYAIARRARERGLIVSDTGRVGRPAKCRARSQARKCRTSLTGAVGARGNPWKLDRRRLLHGPSLRPRA